MPPMTTDRDELIGPPMSEAIAADHTPGVGSAKGPASRASRGEGMREDIEFNADGVTLRGWFYLPDGADGEVPCIVMAHGFSAIKEMHLEVDADRIGVWGSSYSGAHSYVVGAIDRRVKAVCGQVPLVSGRRAFEMLVRIDNWAQTWEALTADRMARARGDAPAMVPVVDADPTAQSALPTPDSYEFFSAYENTSWRNEVTLRTLEML